jgi:shikimate 5-dehydrogenase
VKLSLGKAEYAAHTEENKKCKQKQKTLGKLRKYGDNITVDFKKMACEYTQ